MAINTTEARYDLDGDEMILPRTHAGLVSIEYKVGKNKSVKKGALVKASHTIGFALSAGSAGDVIPVCIRCNLVDFPGTGQNLVAGDRIVGDMADIQSFAKSTKGNDWRADRAIGIVHEAATKADSRIKLVFAHD